MSYSFCRQHLGHFLPDLLYKKGLYSLGAKENSDPAEWFLIDATFLYLFHFAQGHRGLIKPHCQYPQKNPDPRWTTTVPSEPE